MRVTVRAKIVVTMAGAALGLLVVGFIGTYGIKQTFDIVRSIHDDDLLAVTAIVEARHSLTDVSAALDRGLLDPTRHSVTDRIDHDVADEGAAWSRYYPAKLSNVHERMLADLYIEQRRVAFGLARQEAALIQSGRIDEAHSMHLARTLDNIGKAARTIDELIHVNEVQAGTAYEDAAGHYSRTRELSLTITGGVLLALAVVATLLTRSITRPLDEARHLALAIQSGRLNNSITVHGDDELTDTLSALREMDEHLAGTVSAIREIAHEVSEAASHLSQGTEDLSQRTQEQASSLEETAASMEQLAAAVHQNAESTVRARTIALRVSESSKNGCDVSSEAMDAMESVTAASERIGEISMLIDEIAFQTNLLALNAAVEAARAGDQGRGFAVVAGEVRALAMRSAVAAKDIKAIVTETVDSISHGAALVSRTANTLSDISKDARAVSDIIESIATASSEQTDGINQVSDVVITLDGVTQRNAALVEQSSAASRLTSDLASELVHRVSIFQLTDSDAAGLGGVGDTSLDKRLAGGFSSRSTRPAG